MTFNKETIVKKTRKYFIYLNFIFIFVFLNFICLESVFAATPGVGVRITIKDLFGQTVAKGIVLKSTISTFDGGYYRVYSGLPNFDDSNASSVLSTWSLSEINVDNLINAAQLGITFASAKANKYTFELEGIYETTKPEYRKSTVTNGVKCVEWKETSYQEPVCSRCRAAGCERYGSRYCNEYNASCSVCGVGGYRTETSRTCVKEYTEWSTTKPAIGANDILETRYIPSFLYRKATTASFETTKIEQATKCGAESTYLDNLKAQDVVGSSIYLDSALGHSTYCPIYCVEENTFTYPGFKPEVDSGGHFTWTIGKTNNNNIINGLTVNLKGKRDCRTTINLEAWLADYNKLIKELEEELEKLKRVPTPEIICNSSISSSTFASGSAGGYHLLATLTYMTEDYTEDYSREHVAANGHESNYYIHKFQHYPEGPKSFTGTNGKTYYIMQYKIYEANPDVCYQSSSSTETSSWQLDPATAKSQLEGSVGTKCGAGFDEEYTDESVSLTNCTEESTVIAYENDCKTKKKRVCDDCYGPLTSDGQCYDGVGCRTVTETSCVKVPIYGYRYKGTLLVRRCDYSSSSGSKVTQNDMKTDCKPTGFYKCPDGYYYYDQNNCFLKDTSRLKALENEQQKMLDTLKDCSTINFNYVLDTEMLVDYQEPKYSRIIPLVQEKVSSSSKENHKVREGNKSVTFYICYLDGPKKWCDKTTKDISDLWIREYGKEFYVEYQYILPREMYQYVLLPNGNSVDVVPDSYGGPLLGFKNYINVGYSNYPVHYTTPKGLYNLDIVYKKVGYKNHFEEHIRSEVPSVIDVMGNITYDCEYTVNNGDPFCPSGGCDTTYPGGIGEDDINGVKLIYRPISLVTPFPGTDGKGREAGSNWNNQTLINKYILNNRNTTGYTIYQKEPMYQISLTPAVINDIRAYNNRTTYDDYNLKCVNGYECKSEFIRNNNVGFSQYFKGCGTGNWNDCDRRDNYTR